MQNYKKMNRVVSKVNANQGSVLPALMVGY
jgi:hypothetical protein